MKEPLALKIARNLENDGKGCSCYAKSSRDCCCRNAIWAQDFIMDAAKELKRLHYINIELSNLLEKTSNTK